MATYQPVTHICSGAQWTRGLDCLVPDRGWMQHWRLHCTCCYLTYRTELREMDPPEVRRV